MPLLIESRAAPPFEKNGYVVACPDTGEAIVVDPGHEVEQLIEVVRRSGVSVRYIMLTHAHLDHIAGCNEAKAEWQVPIVLHEADRFLYDRAVQQGIAFGIRMRQQPPVDAWFDQQAHWTFGNCTVDVHHTPGHSPGQVCLQIRAPGSGHRAPDEYRQPATGNRQPEEGRQPAPGNRQPEEGRQPATGNGQPEEGRQPATDNRQRNDGRAGSPSPALGPTNHLFVGDTLFAGSIGRTDLPGGNLETLLRSVNDVLFPLGDDSLVYPGHGPTTTIGTERRTNPYVRQR